MENKKQPVYNQDSIKTIEFGEAANTRIGMYLSADAEHAIFLGLREIISNSVDEYLQGYGKKITIMIDTKKQEFSVEDEGRGIPVGIRKDGSNSLIAALTLPHTGGKLDEETYNSVIGTNGIGSSVVTHTAEYSTVRVSRDGKLYGVDFTHSSKGAVTEKGVYEISSSTKTGTKITYKPSPLTYKKAKLEIKTLQSFLNELQYLTPQLLIELIVDGQKTTYFSKNGLADALDKDSRLHTNPLVVKGEVEGVQVEFALQWDKEGSQKFYANSLHMPDGGAFVTGFRTSLTRAFNSAAGKEFSGDLIRKYLSGFVAIKVRTPQFSNQSKTSLANPEARTAVSQFTTEKVKEFFTRYPKDLEQIIKILEVEQKAEEAARRSREAAKNMAAGGKNMKAIKDLPSKLADCRDRNGELWILEGDSAAGAAKTCRDPKTQAIMPLRGKILNTFGKELADIVQNKEVKDIVTALGTGISDQFKIHNLRYDKIIILSDADNDGRHINLLVQSLFVEHLPELLKSGKVYLAQPPLYKATIGNKATYLYTEEELEQNNKASITRFKGIGEMSPSELWETTMNPDSRTLIQLTTKDIAETHSVYNTLMGKSSAARKAFIIANNLNEDDFYDFDFYGEGDDE